MSIAGATDERVEERHSEMSIFAEARWLAGQEIKRSWLSYPATALMVLFFGYFAASTVDGFLVLEGFGEGGKTFQDRFDAWFSGYIFISFSVFLGLNWMSREYWRVFSEDAFSKRLAFVRGLPISASTLVLGRLMSMCPALLLNTPAFFVPVYWISDLSELRWNFLWFVAVWIGYSFIGTGISLLAEFAISGRVYLWATLVGVFVLFFGLIALEFTVDLALVSRTAGLVQTYGPLPALASVLLGAAALAILTRATIRRVERRDLYA